MKSIALPLLFITQLCVSGQNIDKGTVILIGIGTDGIVIAADSRATNIDFFSNGTARVNYYRDSATKIYLDLGHPIAYTGLITLDKRNFRDAITPLMAKNNLPKDATVFDKIDWFAAEFAGIYDRTRYPTLKHSRIYTAGYIKNKAHIYSYLYLEKDTFLFTDDDDEKTIIASGLLSNELLKKYFPDISKRYSCTELANRFEKIIIDCGKKYRKSVGGPVSIVQINPDNTFKFRKNDFTKSDFNQLSKHYISPQDTAIWNRQAIETKNIQSTL